MNREPPKDHEPRQTAKTPDYRERLIEAAEASPRFAGAELRNDSSELHLFGVGSPSPRLAALLEEAPLNVRVSWHAAPYSRAELTAEVQRLMNTPALGTRLYSGWARHDGTGVTFTTDDQSLLAAEDPQRMVGATYPVTFERGRPATAV